MEITKESLMRQKQALAQEAANAMQRFHRLQGAIGYCESLLEELEEEIPTIEEVISQAMPGAEILEMVNVDPDGRKIEGVAKGVSVDETKV